MQAFGWYVNRIKQMSPGELIYRLRQAVVQQAQSRGLGAEIRAPVRERPLDTLHWLADAVELEKDEYLRAAQRLLQGRMSLFALDDAPLGHTPNWNRDLRTGLEAPLTFGKKLDYRDQRLVGDIKYLWEVE